MIVVAVIAGPFFLARQQVVVQIGIINGRVRVGNLGDAGMRVVGIIARRRRILCTRYRNGKNKDMTRFAFLPGTRRPFLPRSLVQMFNEPPPSRRGIRALSHQ